MPQTPNGKTDQKALMAEPVEYQHAYREPVTAREKRMCRAFEETLELTQVGLDDNFFELGGDSLSAVALVLHVEEALSLRKDQLEFGDVYQYPTPALLLDKLYKNAESAMSMISARWIMARMSAWYRWLLTCLARGLISRRR